jgi:hypothetical protein
MSSLTRHEMQETAVLHLKDANDDLMYADGQDGQPDLTKPMRVRVYGPGSKQYAKALNNRQNRGLDLLKRTGKVKETSEEAAMANAEFLSDCTHSFENVDSDNGHSGRDLAMEIYLNQKLSFIRDQVSSFASQTANFTPASTKT